MTIMERARSMRLHVGLPLQLWVDVVDIVVYLINIGPSSSLDGGIPKEEWKGKNKATQWKPMVVERGKTCSKFKEKSNFNREVGK